MIIKPGKQNYKSRGSRDAKTNWQKKNEKLYEIWEK